MEYKPMQVALIILICCFFSMFALAYFVYLKIRQKRILSRIKAKLLTLVNIAEKELTVSIKIGSPSLQVEPQPLPTQQIEPALPDPVITFPMQSVDVFPFTLLETQYAQTISEQRYLYQSLLKEAEQHTDEVRMLDQLLKSGQITNLLQQHSLTLVSSLTPDLCKRMLPSDMVLPNIIGPLKLSEDAQTTVLRLEKLIDSTQNLLILNPHVASILFLYPSLIKLLSQKIKKSLIFPAYIKKNLFQIEWGTTFREEESDGENYWRWALYKEANFFIVNNSPITQQLSIKSYILLLDNSGPAVLKIYFMNQCFNKTVENNDLLEIKIDMPPGKHRLSIVDVKGLGVKQEGWAQRLYFGLANLVVSTVNGETELSKHTIYANTPFLSLHDDETIRSILHNSSFYEVGATAFTSEKMLSQTLHTTRFHYLDTYYSYSPASTSPEEFEPNTIWYVAKRTATLLEA